MILMNAQDFRQEAWRRLGGKWLTLAIASLVYSLIMGVCSAFAKYVIGGVAALLLTGPFIVGFVIMTLHVVRREDISVDQLFEGFKDFGSSSVALYVVNTFLIILWTLLLVIPGIIKAYSYSMSYYILVDEPNLTPDEARRRSMAMMEGNRWRLFCLHLSFIGWIFLSALTFGVLLLWVYPYIRTAEALFYEDLKTGN